MTLTTNNTIDRAKKLAALVIGNVTLGNASLMTDYPIKVNDTKVIIRIYTIKAGDNRQCYFVKPDVETMPRTPRTAIVDDQQYKEAYEFFAQTNRILSFYTF